MTGKKLYNASTKEKRRKTRAFLHMYVLGIRLSIARLITEVGMHAQPPGLLLQSKGPGSFGPETPSRIVEYGRLPDIATLDMRWPRGAPMARTVRLQTLSAPREIRYIPGYIVQ